MLIDRAPAGARIRIPLWLRITGAVIFGLVVAGIVLLATHWPFSKEKVERALGGATSRPVRIRTFHQMYFPPGCTAEGITILNRGGGEGPPLVTIEKLVIQGSLTGMFSSPQRLAQVRVVGLRARIPPKGHGGAKNIVPLNGGSGGKALAISKIVADGALLEFVPEERGKKLYKLMIDKLAITHVGAGEAMRYRAVLTNSEPPGVIRSEGRFGPWNPDEPGETPVSGTFRYDDMRLGIFHGISGKARAHGKFAGRLGRIGVDGSVETPDFHVSGSALTTRLAVDFHALVNGTNGNTSLDPANARFLRTEVSARGPIAGVRGEKGKTATLAMAIRGGRLEDLLRLFVSDKTAPMSGEVSLEAKVVWPPGPQRFLEKLRMDIDFGIGAGHFASPATQGSLDRLSESAAGESKKEEKEDPRTVLSDLRGHVSVRGGVAHFSHVTFTVPGAAASIEGTYGLRDERVDLHGVLDTRGHISDVPRSGFKSFILKAITPFFKKKQESRIVPFRITGAWGNAKVGLDLKGP